MKIIAGLGNPGPKYETTRHNAGFLAVDRLIDKYRASGPQNAYDGELYLATIGGEKVLLVKPQTFMNVSGKCLGPVFRFYKCAPEDLIVIHDEVDLPPLALRLKTGGGTGGHNGLKSIDASIGSDKLEYHRIRIGVGKPIPGQSQLSTADHVLQQFSDEELQKLDPILDRVADACEMIVRGQMREAMNTYNRSEGN